MYSTVLYEIQYLSDSIKRCGVSATIEIIGGTRGDRISGQCEGTSGNLRCGFLQPSKLLFCVLALNMF